MAVGDVIIAYLEALSKCEEYTTEDALFDFAFGIASEFVGDKLGDLVAKYGKKVVAAGLRKLGLDEAAEKLLREADEVVDDVIPSPKVCSFSEETLVSTDEGYLAIGDIEIGDYVLAFNEETGEVGYYPVTAVWEHDDPVIVYLTIDDETIETTPEHPFYTTDGEWVAAGELHEGVEIYKADSSYGVVENAAFVYQLQPMYNLTVATAHTYFVGDGEWLVHNTCLIGNKTVAEVAGNTSVKLGQDIVTASVVEEYARRMKAGTFYWHKMSDKIEIVRTTDGPVLIQGHHRFLAAQLTNTPIPETAIKYRDIPRWSPATTWDLVRWSGF